MAVHRFSPLALHVPEDIWNMVLDYCRDEANNGAEACGILITTLNDLDHIVDWQPHTNVAEFPRYRYALDQAEQVERWTALDEAGLRPRVLFHSHLIGDASLSDTDIRYAAPMHRSIGHLVVALSQRSHALWWVRDDQVVQGELMIEETPVTRGLTREAPGV